MYDEIKIPRLGEVIAKHARACPDAVAATFGERKWTYAVLTKHADRIAAALIRDGIGPDDRVGYLSHDSDYHPILAIAAARAGFVIVPIKWRLSLDEVEPIVIDAALRVMFVDEDSSLWKKALPDMVVLPADILLESAWLGDTDGVRDFRIGIPLVPHLMRSHAFDLRDVDVISGIAWAAVQFAVDARTGNLK